jgi:hypothetical protein
MVDFAVPIDGKEEHLFGFRLKRYSLFYVGTLAKNRERPRNFRYTINR